MSGPSRHEPPSGAARDGAPIDVAAFARACRRLQGRLDRLAGRLSDSSDDVAQAARAVEEFVDEVVRWAGVAGVASPPRPAAGMRHAEGVMSAEAEAGATSVEILRDPDGTCRVSIGGRRPFGVAPKLAALVTVLGVPGGTTHDGAPGWRTHAEIATALNKRTGGGLEPRGVPRVVHKLRRAFREAGENHLLVQTNRAWGVRLAVRR